jgi:hypothetical protein
VPFTPSHAAAVLPFLRTPLPTSALVVGSLAPDLPFYLPVQLPWPTHTAVAVVTTDLVLGALAWLLWHGVLAEPALATSPRGLRARLADRTRPGLRRRLASGRGTLLVLAALVLGAATHVLWDEFTHPRRWGSENLPALAETWWLLPGYRWAQYVSSLLGMVVLVAWFLRWWRRAPEVPDHAPAPRWPWLVLLAIGGLTGVVAALAAPSIGSAAFAGATWGGGTAVAAAIVLAAGWHLRRVSRAAA